MKKILLLLAVAFLSIVSNAQEEYDYSLEGLAKACSNYDKVCPFHNGRAIVKKDGKYGVIDKHGNEVVQCEYYEIRDYCEGFAIVAKEYGKYGVIDVQGKEIVPCVYYKIRDYSEGLAVVQKKVNSDYKYGYIDSIGKEIIPCKYRLEPQRFRNSRAVIIGADGKGLIDKTGKLILPCIYNRIEEFSEGLAFVESGAKYGYKKRIIDINGKTVSNINEKYSQVRSFLDGLCLVSKAYCVGTDSEGTEEWGIKQGFIDKSGKEVIPIIYSSCSDFSEGLCLVEKDNKYSFIDKQSNIVIQLSDEYPIIFPFCEGISLLGKCDDFQRCKYVFIDKSGKQLFSDSFDDASSFSEGLAVIAKEGGMGYIDKKGRTTFDF